MRNIALNPRRIGHVNLYVADLERSISFYERICGVELVRREPGIRGGFHSNGNTHHDIGLIEVSRGIDRIGRDGKVQIAAGRGTQVGLNHIGWEMKNEAQLVAAYRRLSEAEIPIFRAFDHLISHSIYLADPDGNVHEFYADVVQDWRSIFNLDHEDLVTSNWDPSAAAPITDEYYPAAPPIRKVADAPLHPRCITGVVLFTRQFDVMKNFFNSVGGLTACATQTIEPRRVVLSGSTGQPDLTLIEASQSDAAGMQMFSFALTRDSDLEVAADRLTAAGRRPQLIDDGRRRAITLTDPDEFRVEFWCQAETMMRQGVQH